MISLLKKSYLFFSLLILLSLNLFPTENEFVLDLNELKRGDLLQSKTRVGGNEMLHFNLEVLSISYNSSFKNSTILAEIRHPYFRENGVLAGMSGSPVYFQGRLLGAIAFTSPFLKKPIVGITHIKTMLTIFEAEKKTFESTQKEKSNLLDPIATPLAIDSRLKLNSKKIAEILKVKNINLHLKNEINIFNPTINSSTSRFKAQEINAHHKTTSELVPGDLIGVNLVRGDIDISAYGTVTYIKDNKILGFGHPIFNAVGLTSLSMYRAFTDAVVPLLTVSYKVGSLSEEIGLINQDRASGIGGIVGEKAKYIPVEISFKTPINDEVISFEVVEDKNIFSGLTSSLLASSFLEFEDVSQPLLVESDLIIATDYENKTINIKNKNVFNNNSFGITSLTTSLRSILNNLMDNKFREISFKKISLDLKVKNKIDYYLIKEAETFKRSFSPGEEVDIYVFLERYRRTDLKKKINFKLPKSLDPGEYQIYISSENQRIFNEFSLYPQKFNIQSLDGLFKFYNQQPANNKLNIWLVKKNRVIISGESFYEDLPFNKIKLLQNNYIQKKTFFFNSYFQEIEFDLPIFGINNVTIEIKNDVFQ